MISVVWARDGQRDGPRFCIILWIFESDSPLDIVIAGLLEFSTRCSWSLCSWPAVSSQVRSLSPTVSTTSVSPSHLPIESPNHVGSTSLG